MMSVGLLHKRKFLFLLFLFLLVAVLIVIRSQQTHSQEKLSVSACSAVTYDGVSYDPCSMQPVETKASVRLCNVSLALHDDQGGVGLIDSDWVRGGTILEGSRPGAFVILNDNKTGKLCALRPNRNLAWKYPIKEANWTKATDAMIADVNDYSVHCRLIWMDVVESNGAYNLVATVSEKHLIQEWEFHPTSDLSERFRIVVSSSRLGSEMSRYAGKVLRASWQMWVRDDQGTRGDAPNIYYTVLYLDDGLISREDRGPGPDTPVTVGGDNSWYLSDGKKLDCPGTSCDARSLDEFCLSFKKA